MEVTPSGPVDEFTAEEPWATPRGPHLPDALGVIPALAWAFVLLAVGRLAWAIHEAGFGPVPDLSRVLSFVLFAVPAVVAVLLPAAVLARHPDALTGARTVLLGTVMVALVQGLGILAQPLEAIFEQLTPASEELPFLVPAAIVYTFLSNLIGSLGLFAIGMGLGRARRYEDRDGTRATVLVIGIAAVLTAAGSLVSLSQLQLGEIQMTPALGIYLGSGAVLGIVTVVAFAYLAIALVRGARADEEPGWGWALAGLGAGLLLVALLLNTAIELVHVMPEGQTGFSVFAYLISGIYALGWLGLLGGLALGLPALGELGEQEEEEEADDADADSRID